MTATEKEETTRATEKKETGAGRRSGYRYLRFLIAFGWWGIVALLITEFVLHPPWGDRSVFGQDVPGEFVLGWCIAGGVLPLLRGNRFRFSGLETYAKRFSGKSWGPDMAVMGVILFWMCSVLWVSLRYASWTRARVKLELLMGIPLLLLMGMIGFALLMFWITGDFPIDK